MTLAQTTTHRNYHRTHAGGHRRVAPETRAQYIAESIILHQAEGHTRTLADYGVAEGSALAALVQGWVERLRA